MNAPTALSEIKNPAPRELSMPVILPGFGSLQSFELLQRTAKAFSSSDLVPKQYQGNLANCMIAMDMAQRIGANPLMVMQNLYIVHGSPSWSSKFLIATINSSGRFTSMRYEWRGEADSDEYGCRAWAVERETNERLDGIWVTWKMVNAEGWSSKNGSKWKTMPDQMFIYRAAAFWQRAYAPEIGMGLSTTEELMDVVDVNSDGSVARVSVESMRRTEMKDITPAKDTAKATPKPTPTPVKQEAQTVDQDTGEVMEADPRGAQQASTDEFVSQMEDEPEQPKQTTRRRTSAAME